MQLKASRIADNCDSVICHVHDSKEISANNHRSEAKTKSYQWRSVRNQGRKVQFDSLESEKPVVWPQHVREEKNGSGDLSVISILIS